MKVKSVQFIQGVGTQGDMPEDEIPHVAFIGRSNVGKSSVINSIVGKKDMARSSSSPGFTKEVNFYLINKNFFLVDVPGYGFAQGSFEARDNIQHLIEWYLSYPELNDRQIIVLIVDAKVGLTELDRQMLIFLNELEKNVIVVANKVDKLKKSEAKHKLEKMAEEVHPYKLIPYSVTEKIGFGALTFEVVKQ